MQHIMKCIPNLSKSIQEHLSQKETEMQSLSVDILAQCDDLGPYALQLITKFSNYYRDMLEGRFVKESAQEFMGGSRISYIFHTMFTEIIAGIDPFEYLTDDDIQTAI